jgi:hypothetical protein
VALLPAEVPVGVKGNDSSNASINAETLRGEEVPDSLEGISDVSTILRTLKRGEEITGEPLSLLGEPGTSSESEAEIKEITGSPGFSTLGIVTEATETESFSPEGRVTGERGRNSAWAEVRSSWIP